MGWVDAGGEGTEHHPVGHYGPITKTLSARQWAYQPPFHTSLINWEEWEEEEGKGKGTSLYQPSKCQNGLSTRKSLMDRMKMGTVFNPPPPRIFIHISCVSIGGRFCHNKSTTFVYQISKEVISRSKRH